MKDQNLFKQKLYHHTMPVPEDLWGKIEAQLPANKKRFPFFWFSMAAGLIAGGALVEPDGRQFFRDADKLFA